MWQNPSKDLFLPGGEVHIWRFDLSISPAEEARCQLLLTPDEQQRADRFYFKKHRSEFIAGRGMLRLLLSFYLNLAPRKIVFQYGKQMKPALGFSNLQFNLSHSHGKALFAFCFDNELGVDLEKLRTDIEVQSLAQQFFSPREAQVIDQLSGDRQYEAFFTCWTRKEAFIKAKGMGLSLPLDQFEVAILPDQAVQLLHTHWDPAEAAQWQLYALDPGADFVGALATRGKKVQLKHWNLSPAFFL